VTAAVDPARNGTAPTPPPVEDFDAFWAKFTDTRRPKALIRGVEVAAPYDIPLELSERIDAATPDDQDTVHDLLAELYGEGIVDRWKAAGMGAIEFFVVLTWSYMRAGGSSATFEDAMAVVQEAFDSGALNDAQTVPNRADRRAAAKGKGRTAPSARTGARSSRTSAASTASPPKNSRG
jgi:hypothetical protein